MITCYGEALVDLFVQPYTEKSMQTSAQACLGGSVFNFCLASARQGLPTSYHNALSQDSFGKQFKTLLEAEGVKLAHATPVSEPTSMAVIELDAQGKATYAFHRQAVADIALTPQQVIDSLPPSAHVLHTGCLMLVPSAWPHTQTIITAARQRGFLISIDANLRPSICDNLAAYRHCLSEASTLADIIKVSDDDLLNWGLVQAQDMADRSRLMHAAADLLQGNTRAIALTLGAQGACWIDRQTQHYSASPSNITVQDTVGAGDSFMAALLASLYRQGHLSTATWRTSLPANITALALSHAIAAAALCVQRVGCDPATWEETVHCAKAASGL